MALSAQNRLYRALYVTVLNHSVLRNSGNDGAETTVLVICMSRVCVVFVYVRSVWLANKSSKQFALESAQWHAAAFTLRQRMLNFVQNFEYYMMFEVIEPNWQLFESNVDTVRHLLIFFVAFLSLSVLQIVSRELTSLFVTPS